MVDPSLQEDNEHQGLFGVSPVTLEKAGHLRDVVFPKAGVSLFIQDRKAYAVTAERELVCIAYLQTLVQMTDAEALAFIPRVVEAHRQGRMPLLDLRVRARFLTQGALASYINAGFDSPPNKPVISAKTIWRAENARPIAETTALLIVAALRERAVAVTIEQVNWVIGHQGKRRKSETPSPPSQE